MISNKSSAFSVTFQKQYLLFINVDIFLIYTQLSNKRTVSLKVNRSLIKEKLLTLCELLLFFKQKPFFKLHFNPRVFNIFIIFTQSSAFLFCRQDFWSTTTEQPIRDPTQDFKLIKASEKYGTMTEVEFARNTSTDDNAHDVQFMVRFKCIETCITRYPRIILASEQSWPLLGLGWVYRK